jgi:hypothetical protein
LLAVGSVCTKLLPHVVVHVAQLDWLAVAVNVPLVHAMHAWSDVVVPAVLTKVPAAHVVHGVQAAAFVVVL